MPTFDGLVDSIISELHARSNSQESYVTLQSDITADTLSFVVDPQEVGRGLFEIDSELLYATTVASGVVTVPAWGRGRQSTTAASHTAGSMVTWAPRFPRQAVKDLVQESIQQLYPDLYGVATTEFTASWRTPQYELPATAVRVLAVDIQSQGVDQDWLGLSKWRFNRQSPTDQFTSGVTVSLAALPYTNTEVRVTYAAEPVALVDGADDFTATGFRSSVADLVRLMVIARMVIGPEVARGQITSAEQSERSALVQTGSTTSVARYFQTLLERKLRAEKQALRERVPLRVVRTWA